MSTQCLFQVLAVQRTLQLDPNRVLEVPNATTDDTLHYWPEPW